MSREERARALNFMGVEECVRGGLPPMHSPSPESPAELMTWVKGGCDVGHRASKPSHHKG